VPFGETASLLKGLGCFPYWMSFVLLSLSSHKAFATLIESTSCQNTQKEKKRNEIHLFLTAIMKFYHFFATVLWTAALVAPTPACQLSVRVACQIDRNATCTPILQREEDCFVQLNYPIEICNTAMSSASISQYDIQITPGISASFEVLPIPGNDCATPFIPNAQIDAYNATATSEVIVFVRSVPVAFRQHSW
jgi:hypothetical protein